MFFSFELFIIYNISLNPLLKTTNKRKGIIICRVTQYVFIRQVEHAASQEPDKSPASTLQARNFIRSLDGERTRAEIFQRLGLKDWSNLAKEYIQPALAADSYGDAKTESILLRRA